MRSWLEFSVNLDTTVPARVYPISKRRQIIEQMRLVLQDFYVHLEMKQAQYGFNSLRALARLDTVLAEISDAEFFHSVIQVITRTRDRHLAFSAYQPNGTKAILPFNIERCWINGVETYVVTRIWGESEAQHLKEGAIVTHWNGVPINRHIRLNANYFDGVMNPHHSLEVWFLPYVLDQFALPIESWVVLVSRLRINHTKKDLTGWLRYRSSPFTTSHRKNLLGLVAILRSFNLTWLSALFAPNLLMDS